MPTVEQIMQAVSDYGRAEQTGGAADIGNAFKRVERMIQQSVQAPIRTADRLPEGKVLVFAWGQSTGQWDLRLPSVVTMYPHEFTHWLPAPTPPQE